MRTERIKAHFEQAAKEFDSNIKKLIPRYDEMIDILVSMIPFSKESEFTMIDLGCGTGTISKAVKDHFPNADITCVDISEKMLEMTSSKMNGGINCIQADFNTFEFPKQYNLILSSLALHHLENDEDKLKFYRKIYSSMTDDGMFINIDIVLGSDDHIQNVYINKWMEFMREAISEEKIISKVLTDYEAEDRPASLVTHLELLKKCGFPCVDVIYKFYNYAVFLGKKQ